MTLRGVGRIILVKDEPVEKSTRTLRSLERPLQTATAATRLSESSAHEAMMALSALQREADVA